jgi:hypothetical protein
MGIAKRPSSISMDMSCSTNLRSNYSEVTEIMTSDRRIQGRRGEGRRGEGRLGEGRWSEGRWSEQGIEGWRSEA